MQLLEALEKHGGGDIAKLAAEIPTKTPGAIKYALSMYYKRNRKDLESGRKNSEAGEAPLDSWLHFLEQKAPESCRFSACLATALKFLALFEKRCDMEDVVLRDCYLYLSDVATGKPPRKLNDESMHFFMENFSIMVNNFRKEDKSKPMEFIRNLKAVDIQEKCNDSKKESTASNSALNPLKVPPELIQLNDDE